MTDKVETTVNPFELKVGGANGIDNADVPVRWCITPDFVTKMENDKVVDPHILLVSVDSKSGEMSRHLVPVAELMTYVRFQRAGEMKLYGWIIDGKVGRKELHRQFMMKKRGEWNTNLINPYDGTPEDSIPGVYIGTSRTVDIPANVFGKEPSPGLKWFVNLWHKGRPQDECHFRKRFLLAISLKWIAMLVFSLVAISVRTAAASVVSLMGWSHTANWKYVWRPFKYTMGMVIRTDGWDGFDFSCRGFWENQRFLWYRKIGKNIFGDDLKIVHLMMMPFTPIIPLVTFGIFYLHFGWASDAAIATLITLGVMTAVCTFIDVILEIIGWIAINGDRRLHSFYESWHEIDMFLADHNLWPTVIALVGAAAFVLLFTLFVVFWSVGKVILLACVFAGVLAYVSLKLSDWMMKWGTLDTEHNDVTNIRELLCPKDGMNLKAEYGYIPKEQRTVRLFFKRIKNALCRPMQM